MLSVFLQDGVLASFLLHKEEEVKENDYDSFLTALKETKRAFQIEINNLVSLINANRTKISAPDVLESIKSLNQTIIKFTQRTNIYKALYVYDAQEDDEISFIENDLFTDVDIPIPLNGWVQVCVFYHSNKNIYLKIFKKFKKIHISKKYKPFQKNLNQFKKYKKYN